MRDRPDSTGFLPSLAGLPTLVVVGAEDQLTPPKDAEAMAKAIPGARLAVIPQRRAPGAPRAAGGLQRAPAGAAGRLDRGPAATG